MDSDDDDEVKIIRHISNTSQSRTSSHGEEILHSEANQNNDDGNLNMDDDEIQMRNPTPTPEITINGRRYVQRTLMSRSRSGESAMFRVERRAMDPSPEEDRTNNDNFDDLVDSEEDVVREHTHADRMQQDPNFRDWERRRRRSRASSSESETERIRHRSQFNPNLRTIHCPDIGGVEELNEFTRQMIAMEEVAGNSDESTGRSHSCRGISCHCSSSERDGSDDMV